MTYKRIADLFPYFDSNGDPASGYVVVAYGAGETPGPGTVLQLATTSTGSNLQSSVTLNSKGMPEVSNAEVFLYANAAYKLAIYPTSTAASAHSGAAMGPIDNLQVADSFITVKDYGALGDGSTNDRAAFVLADSATGNINVTAGTYVISSSLTISSPICFEEGAMLKPTNGALITINSYVNAGGYKIFDLSEITTQTITATASQTIFTLSNPYVLGSGNLFVKHDDSSVTISTGYTETDTTTVTTTFGVASGINMHFTIGGIQFGSALNDFADIPTGNTHPEWWGAEGVDGVGDDTTAVQRCLDTDTSVEFLQRYPVTKVTISGNERRVYGNNFMLLGVASTATSSVLELKCGYSTLYGLRADSQFKTDYECGIHWYTNILPGNITGVDGFWVGGNRFYGLHAGSAQVGLNIGALPSQSASAMPAQASTTEVAPTAINAPLSESDVFGFDTENCLKPLRMRQGNGKVNFHGAVCVQGFGTWSTSLPTSSVSIEGVDGGEMHFSGGAIENVADSSATGNMIVMDNGNIYMEGVTTETVSKSYLKGNSTLKISKCPNFAINSNTYPMFAVQYDGNVKIEIDNQKIGYPNARFAAGTNPLVRSVLDTNLSVKPSDNLVVQMTDVEMIDVPFNGSNSPVTGGRVIYNNCSIESIPSPGADRDTLHRLDTTGPNLLDGAVDVSGSTISAYPQTAGATSGGWTFALTDATQSWGSTATGIPTPELQTMNKFIRMTTTSGKFVSATSPKFDVTPSRSYIWDAWVKTDGGGATIVFKAKFYDFAGTASAVTAETNFIVGSSSIVGTEVRPLQGLFKTPSDCTQMELFYYCENGAEMYIIDNSVRGGL